MQQYLDLIENVLTHGVRKSNRTGVDTLSLFHHSYKVDLGKGFPLLTTKDMSGGVWNSLIRELLWYLSGEHHIREFTKHSSIWDSWADENGNLQTAYGRFWRRYPVPDLHEHMPGEAWPLGKKEAMRKYIRDEDSPQNGRKILVFDQISHLIDTLKNSPHSRRMVLLAWHPANASVSLLPPCHYTACFNVSDGRLHCHLTQRSGDVGLGVPFNIASYAALTHVLAKCGGLEPGYFGHSIVDAHIYCGDDEDDPYSHVPQLREQLQREPRVLPQLTINSGPVPGEELGWLDALSFRDFKLTGYDPHGRLRMKVAV